MRRLLDVAIYDTTGKLVRWNDLGQRVSGLRFDSALPGGYSQCSFAIGGPAGAVCPVAAGQTLHVRQDGETVWWGWVEDVQTLQRGAINQVSVLAMGPWQQLQQRLVDQAWSDVTSTYIVRDALASYCPEISQDYSQLANSGVPLTRDFEHETVATLVNDVCAIGDDSQRPLLFAIWEPPGSRIRVGTSGNLVSDPEMEQEDTYWLPDLWDIYIFQSTLCHSPRYSWKYNEGATGGVWQRRRIPVAGSTAYIGSYWVYVTPWAGMVISMRLDWYSASGFISSSYIGALTSDGVTTGWQHQVESVTSPPGAVEVKMSLGAAVGTGGGSSRFLIVDDVSFYVDTTNLSAELRPRAHLWSRDLTDYDYTLRTAALEQGVKSVTTTRDLANAVLAKYGSSSYTSYAEDATSQALYRRRDYLLQAGQVALMDAQAKRDVHLGLHATPGIEMASFSVSTANAVRTRTGQPVDPARLRAGDRLRIVDGRLAGSVIMLTSVSWQDGVATCQPESYEDVTRVLARV